MQEDVSAHPGHEHTESDGQHPAMSPDYLRQARPDGATQHPACNENTRKRPIDES